MKYLPRSPFPWIRVTRALETRLFYVRIRSLISERRWGGRGGGGGWGGTSEKSGMDVAQGFALISHPSVAVHSFSCTDTFGKLL